MMAFMPEPHILLMVVVGTPTGIAGAERRLARRRLAEPRGQHAAHDDFLHVGGRDLRRPRGALDGGGAELRRGDGREHALKRADGRAHGGNDDDVVCWFQWS